MAWLPMMMRGSGRKEPEAKKRWPGWGKAIVGILIAVGAIIGIILAWRPISEAYRKQKLNEKCDEKTLSEWESLRCGLFGRRTCQAVKNYCVSHLKDKGEEPTPTDVIIGTLTGSEPSGTTPEYCDTIVAVMGEKQKERKIQMCEHSRGERNLSGREVQVWTAVYGYPTSEQCKCLEE